MEPTRVVRLSVFMSVCLPLIDAAMTKTTTKATSTIQDCSSANITSNRPNTIGRHLAHSARPELKPRLIACKLTLFRAGSPFCDCDHGRRHRVLSVRETLPVCAVDLSSLAAFLFSDSFEGRKLAPPKRKNAQISQPLISVLFKK